MPRESSFASLVAVVILLAAGTIARIWVAGGELWLDEIWSLSFAREMTVPWQVVTAIHHDNNHPLNTLSLWAVVKIAGAHAPPLLFRLLPLATGIGTIVLIFWTERRNTDRDAPAAAWLAAIFAATSFLRGSRLRARGILRPRRVCVRPPASHGQHARALCLRRVVRARHPLALDVSLRLRGAGRVDVRPSGRPAMARLAGAPSAAGYGNGRCLSR